MSQDTENTSSATTEEKKTPLRPRSRLLTRFFSIVQISLFGIVLIAANFLTCTNYSEKDLTEDKSYELSKMTERVLESDAVAKRDKPVKLIVAFARSHPFSSRLKIIAEEYRRIGQGKIEVEILDPLRNPDRAEALSELYRIRFNRQHDNLVIVDARQEEDQVFQEALAPREPGAPLDAERRTQLELSSRVRFINYEDIGIFDTNSSTGRDLIGWQDEDAITSAILSAVEGRARRIYFIEDKSEVSDTGKNTPWKLLSGALYYQNIAFVPIKISNISTIPKDADGLAIIAPKYDFNDREMKILEDYWNRQRSSILVMLSPESRPDKLRTFLRAHGITPRNDRILTVQNGKPTRSVRAVFTQGPEINVDLGGKSTQFDGTTCSLEVRENASDLLNRRISPIALIQANNSYWGESDFTAENPTLSADNDTPGPVYFAAAVIRGNANDDQSEERTSRMVVISNADFLNPQFAREENIDFLKSSTNWLIGRKELIGTPPKSITTRRLNFLKAQISFINKISLFLMPAISLVIGLFVWNIRRR